MLGFLKRLVMAGTVLFAPLHAGIVVWYSLSWVAVGTSHWLVDALSYVLPVLLILSVLHLPGAFWRRSKLLISAAAFPLVLFGVFYGPSYLPKSTPKDSSPSLTVMSYNVWGGNKNYNRILGAIDDFSPDVVGLQELNDRIALEIQDDLADRYPYWSIDSDQALFSRYPIVNRNALTLGDTRAPITVQHIDIEVDSKTVGIIHAHPHSPKLMSSRLLGLRLGYPSGLMDWWRDLEVRELIDVMNAIEGPLIVLGDFNMTELQAVYGEMTETLLDAHKEAGYGLGLTRTPLRSIGPATWRIDYVFHTPDIIALSARVGSFGGSDHRPVVAELAFRDA